MTHDIPVDRLPIQAIKAGQLFWECEAGQNAAFTAVADARVDGMNVTLPARSHATREITVFGARLDAPAYAPKLYRTPQYRTPAADRDLRIPTRAELAALDHPLIHSALHLAANGGVTYEDALRLMVFQLARELTATTDALAQERAYGPPPCVIIATQEQYAKIQARSVESVERLCVEPTTGPIDEG